MEKKAKFHGFYRIFHDILRDNNSTKYSMTKFAALIGLISLFVIVITALVIMINKNEVDHVLIGEVIGFILTLLGFKNNFGFRKAGDSQTIITDGSLTTTTDGSVTTTTSGGGNTVKTTTGDKEDSNDSVEDKKVALNIQNELTDEKLLSSQAKANADFVDDSLTG